MSVANLAQKDTTSIPSYLSKRKTKVNRLDKASYKIHRLIIPLFMALVFFLFTQFLVAQKTGIAYESAKLEDKYSNIVKIKRNYEMVYEDLTNPVILRKIAEKKGFIVPEKVYSLREYLELPHLVSNNEP